MAQVRLTGDPYVVHLVETACIVECLLEITLKEADERRALCAGHLLLLTRGHSRRCTLCGGCSAATGLSPT